MIVNPPAAQTPPFGFVDTPTNHSVVAGTINVTGWALDDAQVVRIQVWRKSVPGEPNIGGQVYIGDAVFLDGARPDLAALHPQMPFNTRAGWGIQVLTNMLPNAAGTGPRGNGQHQLFVYAFDAQGKSTLLGSPVINVNNATAAKPFGTIDKPENGETISGAGYLVWGWALTPQPGLVPFDASTIWMFIDGVPYGHSVYNLHRVDVSTLFPGLNNSGGPVGYFQLDTTKLTNGMHSIAWSVTDNMGRVEGIGSRLFFVQNISPAAASVSSPKAAPMRSAAREGVWMRTGYDPEAQLTRVQGNDIEVAHGRRLELHVAGAASVESTATQGCRSVRPYRTVFSTGSSIRRSSRIHTEVPGYGRSGNE